MQEPKRKQFELCFVGEGQLTKALRQGSDKD